MVYPGRFILVESVKIVKKIAQYFGLILVSSTVYNYKFAGGLLGLCMGFSLVSLFEIVYHILGAFRKWWHDQNSRTKEVQNEAVNESHTNGKHVFTNTFANTTTLNGNHGQSNGRLPSSTAQNKGQ